MTTTCGQSYKFGDVLLARINLGSTQRFELKSADPTELRTGPHESFESFRYWAPCDRWNVGRTLDIVKISKARLAGKLWRVAILNLSSDRIA